LHIADLNWQEMKNMATLSKEELDKKLREVNTLEMAVDTLKDESRLVDELQEKINETRRNIVYDALKGIDSDGDVLKVIYLIEKIYDVKYVPEVSTTSLTF
jgi:3-dehydroquinate dehydratase